MRAGCIDDSIVDGWRKIFQLWLAAWRTRHWLASLAGPLGSARWTDECVRLYVSCGAACGTPDWAWGGVRRVWGASAAWDRPFDDSTSLSMTGCWWGCGIPTSRKVRETWDTRRFRSRGVFGYAAFSAGRGFGLFEFCWLGRGRVRRGFSFEFLHRLQIA
jgi:hypothetical protein